MRINDAGWLASHIDPAATGPQAIVDQVNGTGPYRLESWTHGSEVSLARNDGYWGDKAANERLIARWYDNAGQRIAELQNASVDGVDDIDPTAVQAVADDTDLKLAPRPGLDVFYAGFTDTFAPFDNELVRRAIATGIDRQHIVDTYFPPGSELATQYTPCEIPHGCGGDAWYEYDPTLAKEMLASAGFPDGFDTKIQYSATPTDYLPDPTGVATELKNQLLANLGIRAELQVVPDDTFLADASAGKLDGIHLLGQTVTYPDAGAFLEARFGSGASPEFGTTSDDIGKALAAGRATALERQARCCLCQGQRRDPQRHPADPDRPQRDECRLPGGRHGCGDVTTRARAVRGDGPRRPTPARLADDRRARRPVLRGRDGRRLGARSARS